MWAALSTISALIALAALIVAVVGVIKGVIGKGWGLFSYSTVILIVIFALITFAETKTVWAALATLGASIAIVALIGAIVGLIKGVVGKGWSLLSYSIASLIACLALFAFAEAKVNLNENGNVNARVASSQPPLPKAPAPESVKSGTSARVSNASDELSDCKNRFRSRKRAVMSLHNDGLLDAYGLSDIGVLNKYGISIEAATGIADILFANGLYRLQNHYDEVAHAICAEVRHDERLIRDGTREAFVNR